MTRRLLPSVLTCLVGAALALYAVTRVWSAEVTTRTGLTDRTAETTGADAAPLAFACAVVALAGAGALVATRGRLRRAVGVLIVLAGAGTAVAAVLGRLGLDPGSAGAAATAGPVACVLGGLAVLAAGVVAARHGHRWRGMDARYDRTAAAPTPPPDGGNLDARSAWDALDRGDDPTDR